MVSSTENFYKIFELLRSRIMNKLLIKEINSSIITLRSDIRNTEEAKTFVRLYEDVTGSRFRLVSNRSAPGKKWICSHRRMNTETFEISPKKCPVMIIIVIKKITKFTRLKDAYLRQNPPLRTEIVIDPTHNHSLTETYDKYIKISSPVKECFYEYFKRGILGARAKHFHETNLKKANFHALDDASMNPCVRAICALYRNWIKLKENVHVDEVSTSQVSTSMQLENVPSDPKDLTDSTDCLSTQTTPFTFDIKNIKCEVLSDEEEFDEISKQTYVLPDLPPEEVVIPILNIKKEIEDNLNIKQETEDHLDTTKEIEDNLNIKKEIDTDEFPVIQSYGSLATEPAASSTAVKRMNSANTQVVVYDKPSNTYKVIKYVSVNYNGNGHLSSHSYLPRTILPPRVAVHRI